MTTKELLTFGAATFLAHGTETVAAALELVKHHEELKKSPVWKLYPRNQQLEMEAMAEQAYVIIGTLGDLPQRVIGKKSGIVKMIEGDGSID